MIKINLLPVRTSKKREAGRQWIVFFALIVVAGVVGNYFWYDEMDKKVIEVKARIVKFKAENAALEKIIGEVKDIKREKDEMKTKLGILNKLKEGRQGPVKVMDELATIIPPKVWVGNWEEQNGAVTIQGSGLNHEEVANFMKKMRESKYFDNVTLKTARMVRDTQVDFTITCNVKYSA